MSYASATTRRAVKWLLATSAFIAISLLVVATGFAATNRVTSLSSGASTSQLAVHRSDHRKPKHLKAKTARKRSQRRSAKKRHHAEASSARATVARATVPRATVGRATVARPTVATATVAGETLAGATPTATTTIPVTPLAAGATDPLTTIGQPSEPPSESDPSGAPMPVGNLPGWNQVYTDDFRTAAPVGSFSDCTPGPTLMTSDCTGLPASVQSQLFAYPDGWSDTSKNGTYEPSQVLSIHDNMLDYNIHSADGLHMVSAVEPKIPGGVGGNGMQYGAYAIRFKADPLTGYKTAFLLWPDSETWPQDGEIDFPEGNLDGTMGAFMHQLGATSGSQQDAYPTAATYNSWHTAVIEWTPTECRFILDGQIVGTSVSLIPNTPMHWVLQAETALSGGAPADDVAGHIYIAWITAYAMAS